MPPRSRVRPASLLARAGLVLAFSAAACAQPAPPVPPPLAKGRAVPTAAAAKTVEEAPAPPPRSFADLGPARLVPQLGVDASHVALSPDGLLAVTGGGSTDLSLQVWDVERKVVVAELATPPSLAQSVLGFAHGGRFVVALRGEAAAVWDAATGQLVGAFASSSSLSPVFDFERDEPEVLYLDPEKKALVLRRLRGGAALFSVPVGAGEPEGLAIAGELCVVRREKSIDVLDRTGKVLETLPPAAKTTSSGAPLEVRTAAGKPAEPLPEWLSKGKYDECEVAAGHVACSAYEDSRTRVEIGDTRGKERGLWRLPPRLPARAELRDEGAGLVLSCGEGQTGVFGFEAGSAELAAAELAARVRAAAGKDAPGARLWPVKGALLAVSDGRIAVWDAATGKKRADLVKPEIFRSSMMDASPDGKLLAVGGNHGDSHVALFDLERGALVRTLDHGHSIWSVGWNPDGKVLVTTARAPAGGIHLHDEAASVKLWEPGTGKLLRTFKDHYNASYTRDNSLFVTWDYSVAQVYDARSLKALARVSGDAMYAMFSPDAKWLITPVTDTSAAHPGMYEGAGIDLRDARTGARARHFGFKTGVVAFSPDSSKLLLSGSESWQADAMSRSFDLGVYAVATGKRERLWSGPGAVEQARFALSGKLVLTLLRGMARLSRTSDGASLWVMPVVAGGQCTAVAFDEAGRWDGDEAAAAAALGFRLGDDLRRSEVVRSGPKVAALRSPGLYRAFVAAAR